MLRLFWWDRWMVLVVGYELPHVGADVMVKLP